MLAKVRGFICSMFCGSCGKLCYWVPEGDFGYFTCPEHGRQY